MTSMPFSPQVGKFKSQSDLSLSIYLSSLQVNRFPTYSDHLPLLQVVTSPRRSSLRVEIYLRSEVRDAREKKRETAGAVGLSSLEFPSECEVIFAVSMQARVDYPARFIAVENAKIAR